MSKNISFKEFMDKVQEKLRKYSVDDLQEIILEWARDTHPDEREEFLSRFALPSPEKPIVADSEILKDVEELATKVENGNYCTGWGWAKR